MFTYVRLKNFKSLGEITFDFRKRKDVKSCKDVKQFIAVYGENGSGKSNFVEGLAWLGLSIINFASRGFIEKIFNDISETSADVQEKVHKLISKKISRYAFAGYRMVDCDKPTEVEYGLLIDGKEWVYTLKFTDRLIEETLYGMRNSIRGVIFNISYCDTGDIRKTFWSELFRSDKFKNDLFDEIDKYWGKYSFLSIFAHYKDEMNIEYIVKNVNRRLFEFIGHALNMSASILDSDGEMPLGIGCKIFPEDLTSGIINEESVSVIETTEKILNNFFVQTYADIKDVFYIKEPVKEGKIKYTLHLKKMIAGSVRTLPFEWESSGTKNLLKKVGYILCSFWNGVSVCDEIDNGTHDLLVESILISAKDELETLSKKAEEDGEKFTGQLIITTHNTLLLESLKPADVYIIDVDYLGNKEAVCLSEYSIQKSDNKRLKYLKGLFGGVPMADSIDFESIIEYGYEAAENREDE